MLVRTKMTPDVVTVSPSTTVAEAFALTRERRIRHLPVVEGGRLVGVATDRDLRLSVPPQGSLPQKEMQRLLASRRVGEVMAQQIVTTSPDTPIEDAAKLLYEHRIGCLPVMEGHELVGILTETDVLRAFVELFGAHLPSSRLSIRMPNRPGELARVVRLIGIDFKLNITGMVVPPLSETEALAIIHVATQDPQELVEALEKMGYQVSAPSQV